MLLETVAALASAGHAALSALRPGAPCAVSVSQLDGGQLAFPSLAVLRVVGHRLGALHLGADGELRRHLLTLADADGRPAGAQVLAERVLEALAANLPGRHVRGRVEHLALAPMPVFTRGVRSFGVRCRADAGQMFLLAEVPSLVEDERERGGATVRRMADACLPRGWAGADALPAGAGEGLAVFLLRSEADVHLVLPAADGGEAEKAAFVAHLADAADGDVELQVAVPVDAAVRARMDCSATLRGRVGVGDRSLEFDLPCRGFAAHDLPGGIRLAGLRCGLPRDVRVVQSRRTFRIPVTEPVDVQIEVDDAGVAPLVAELADLSFSGARLRCPAGAVAGDLAAGDRLRCRLHLPGEEDATELRARVRRVGRDVDDPARPRVVLGVEFEGPGDDGAASAVRRFVLDQERHRLSRRVHVAAVADW